MLEDIGTVSFGLGAAFGASATLAVLRLRWRILRARPSEVDFDALTPEERKIVRKRTGGRWTRPDGAALTLADFAQMVREETAEQRELGAFYRTAMVAEDLAQRALLARAGTEHLKRRVR